MILIDLAVFNGIGVGIEHIDGDDEEVKWVILIDFLFLRLAISKIIPQ